MEPIAALPTPFVAIDIARLRANIADMQALATRAGVRLRPHTKTHKSPVIAKMQLEAGAAGICCAIVDDLDVARGWSERRATAARSLDVLVKVDVGTHRVGIDPEAPQALTTIRGVAALPGVNFRGLLSHAGHSYNVGSSEEIRQVAAKEIEIHRKLADAARDAGVDVAEISVGSTPSSRFIGEQKGVTEMRPGNYVFFDRTQYGLESATLEQ